MHIGKLVAAAVLTGLIASCEQPASPPDAPSAAAPPAATGFRYAAPTDVSGYYMPADEVRFGPWSLGHIFVGQANEFRDWEGGDREDAFAPVMLHFDDVTSPMVATEIGESRSRTVRVLPTSYDVSDTGVRFAGAAPGVGRVTFDGRLDPEALATARRNLGDEGVVLTGTLTVDGVTRSDVRMRWWMGD